MDYALKIRVSGTFDVVTQAVERAISAHGFVVVSAHDVHVTLAIKGFSIKPIRIYEVRDPEDSSDPMSVRGADLPDAMSGRISVFVDGTDVVIAVVRLGIVTQMFPDVDHGDATEAFERRIMQIVEDAVRS